MQVITIKLHSLIIVIPSININREDNRQHSLDTNDFYNLYPFLLNEQDISTKGLHICLISNIQSSKYSNFNKGN